MCYFVIVESERIDAILNMDTGQRISTFHQYPCENRSVIAGALSWIVTLKTEYLPVDFSLHGLFPLAVIPVAIYTFLSIKRKSTERCLPSKANALSSAT